MQTKLDELSVNDKSGMPDLTAATITELLVKPKLASWMRQCGDALGDYVKAVERPVARPVGRAGGGGDHGDRLAYRMWSELVKSQKAYTEMFADPAALSASQATNPLDGLALAGRPEPRWGQLYLQRYQVCHEGRGVALEDSQRPLGARDSWGIATLQALPGHRPERGGSPALALPVPQQVLNSRDRNLGMGARFLWSQARRWSRTGRQHPGDNDCGTFSCGSAGVDGCPYRCSPAQCGDCRHAQLGVSVCQCVSG